MKVKLNFTAEELKREIRRVWRTIPREEMDNLVLPRGGGRGWWSLGERTASGDPHPTKKPNLSFPGRAFVL
jgi:hypothetical protein